MAFFKFRLPGFKAAPDAAGAATQTETLQTLRHRARHRLIGAAVLVLAAIIGFPMLLDSQPRPVDVNIPIAIPERGKTAPLVIPPPPASAPTPQAPALPPAAALGEREEILAAQKPAAAPQNQPSAVAPQPEPPKAAPAPQPGESTQPTPAAPSPAKPAAPKPEAKPAAAKPAAPKPTAPQPAANKQPTPAEPSRQARPAAQGRALAAKPAPAAAKAAADKGRYIVQVGAFADVTKARETRLKIERAGLSTYTQVVETPQGRRTRVRVGPFANQAEVDKAATKIKALGLPASVLTL